MFIFETHFVQSARSIFFERKTDLTHEMEKDGWLNTDKKWTSFVKINIIIAKTHDNVYCFFALPSDNRKTQASLHDWSRVELR